MEEYYIDELPEIVEAWNRLHDPDAADAREVDPMTFLGGDGEWVLP